MDCVDTAPTPDRTKGQLAPTAKAQVVTATAKAPVAGSCATMDQVMRVSFRHGRWMMAARMARRIRNRLRLPSPDGTLGSENIGKEAQPCRQTAAPASAAGPGCSGLP